MRQQCRECNVTKLTYKKYTKSTSTQTNSKLPSLRIDISDLSNTREVHVPLDKFFSNQEVHTIAEYPELSRKQLISRLKKDRYLDDLNSNMLSTSRSGATLEPILSEDSTFLHSPTRFSEKNESGKIQSNVKIINKLNEDNMRLSKRLREKREDNTRVERENVRLLETNKEIKTNLTDIVKSLNEMLNVNINKEAQEKILRKLIKAYTSFNII